MTQPGRTPTTTRHVRHSWRRLVLVLALATLVAALVATAAYLFRPTPTQQGIVSPTSSATTPPAGSSSENPSRAELEAVLRSRVLFGHQSIGMNILDAVAGVYTDAGLSAPTIADRSWPQARDTTDPVLAHSYIGTNGDPEGKIRDFASLFGQAGGASYDIAFMKIGPVDIHASTDIQAIFDAYASTIQSLEKAYPRTTFLYTTVALTTEESGWTPVAASQVGVPASAGDSDNARREQYNALVRDRFASTGRLFDLAELESELPDGTIATKTVDGVPSRVMNPAFSDDGLHLNAAGAKHLANGMLAVVGRVALEKPGASPS